MPVSMTPEPPDRRSYRGQG